MDLPNVQPHRDARTGIVTMDAEPMVFHCNHYNRFLQLVVEDCHYIKREPILTQSAMDVARRQLTAHFINQPELSRTDRLAYAQAVYQYCGFGNLPLANLPATDHGHQLVESHSHYGQALRLNYGKRGWPGEFFDVGFAMGALAAVDNQSVTGKIFDDAISMGNTITTLQLSPAQTPLSPSLEMTELKLPIGADLIPEREIGLHIDEAGIIAAVCSLPLYGNNEGLIPAFGVNLTRHYADYYNLVSFRFEKALEQALSTHRYLGEMLWYEYPSLFFYKDKFSHLQGRELASTLLVEAGHICGFNTMGGIMRSDAWYQLIVPQLRTRDDWLSGIVACINALGWGVWRIFELIPNERLVIRAWHPYESLGHLRHFGSADHPIDYLMVGIASSLMNLLYNADITTKPDLTLAFYYQVNRSKQGFWGRQTACVAMGDAFSEVVVERAVL
jgi:hypothetical protein